jgi:hypothetical protein
MEIISAFVLLSVEPPSAWPQRASWLFDRDLRVFAWADGIGHLDHAHFAAETAKHLAEFEPDITAADGNQMRRQLLQIHDVAIGQNLYLIETRNGKNRWPRTVLMKILSLIWASPSTSTTCGPVKRPWPR